MSLARAALRRCPSAFARSATARLRRSFSVGGSTALGVIVGLLIPVLAAAQFSAPPLPSDVTVYSANEPARALKEGKVVAAFRIVESPPAIDGRLNDEAWTFAGAATDFIQRDPTNGDTATEATRLQFAYDDRYLSK